MDDLRTQIFDYIVDHKTRNDGLSPTLAEICEALNISTKSVVVYHLDRLELAGLIERCSQARGIRVTGGRWIAPGVSPRGRQCE